MIKIPEIKLFISDVDGTLTDGGMYYTAEGEIMKKFNTRDAVASVYYKNVTLQLL
jgi:3-deoxy-D-manno-octulosonate 8-phosphate phosphatase KdsC-like HAD superfamily phosphatase